MLTEKSDDAVNNTAVVIAAVTNMCSLLFDHPILCSDSKTELTEQNIFQADAQSERDATAKHNGQNSH